MAPVDDVNMIRLNLFLENRITVVNYNEHKGEKKFHTREFQRTLENTECTGYGRFDHFFREVCFSRDGRSCMDDTVHILDSIIKSSILSKGRNEDQITGPCSLI
jgi:hypothetical protein